MKQGLFGEVDVLLIMVGKQLWLALKICVLKRRSKEGWFMVGVSHDHLRIDG